MLCTSNFGLNFSLWPSKAEQHAADACTVQVLFRSVNKLLMDTSTSEYLFCIDFFQEDSPYHELIAPNLITIETALAAHLQVGLSPPPRRP